MFLKVTTMMFSLALFMIMPYEVSAQGRGGAGAGMARGGGMQRGGGGMMQRGMQHKQQGMQRGRDGRARGMQQAGSRTPAEAQGGLNKANSSGGGLWMSNSK